MSTDTTQRFLARIADAAEANDRLVAELAGQAQHEHGLLDRIQRAHKAGELDILELHEIYLAYREITRSAYPASWSSAGLPHPNTILAAARKRATPAVARSDPEPAENAPPQ